jgi:hypothetical protein
MSKEPIKTLKDAAIMTAIALGMSIAGAGCLSSLQPSIRRALPLKSSLIFMMVTGNFT